MPTRTQRKDGTVYFRASKMINGTRYYDGYFDKEYLALAREDEIKKEVLNGTWIHPSKRKISSSNHESEKFNVAKAEMKQRAEVLIEKQVICPSITEFKTQYLEYSKIIAKNKTRTLKSKELHLKRHIEPYFGDKKLNVITDIDIEDFIMHLSKKNLKGKTINHILSTLKNLMERAKKRGVINVVPDIIRVEESKPDICFLNFDESKKLIEVADERIKMMIYIGLVTGLRLGELMACTWSKSIDFDNKQLVVYQAWVDGEMTTPKNHKTRYIDLSDQTLDKLRIHMRNTKHPNSDFVFHDVNGDIYTKNKLRRPLNRAFKKAEIKLPVGRHGGWHILRHSFVSHLIMNGAILNSVMELAGHANIQTTMKYAHLADGINRDSIIGLDSIYENKQIAPNLLQIIQ